ncbi:AMP-binding protein [Lentzea sp. E54]|uniref:AMP-binding protein n=1 Tax=Lentzea xerophila TaxID=3435883 RepID=UPI003DA3D2C3
MTGTPTRGGVAARFHAVAGAQPDKAALVCGTVKVNGVVEYTTTTYGELAATAHRFAAALTKAGVRKATKTALACPPGRDLFAVVFALLDVGAVPVVADPGLGLRALTRGFRHVRPQALLGGPQAHAHARANRFAFGSVRTWLTTAATPCPGARSLVSSAGGRAAPAKIEPDDLASIGFTTGSTGPALPVETSHGGLSATADLVAEVHGLCPDDVSLVLSPFLAVLDLMNGLTCVLPPVRPAALASADPAVLADAINRFRVTTFFASPPVLDALTGWLRASGTRVPSVRKVITGGAPVPPALLDSARPQFHPAARLITTYGSTEALPMCSFDQAGLAADRSDWGTPLGSPVPGTELRLVAPDDGRHGDPLTPVATGQVGEIVVTGPQVSTRYHRSPESDRARKIEREGRTWHRTGDLGRIDEQGVVWFQGRISHAVPTRSGLALTAPWERLFDEHPAVRRSALVGVAGQPVVCVELQRDTPRSDWPALRAELQALAQRHEMTRHVAHFLPHRGFPVDIRHNAKIRRDLLSKWAAEQLAGRGPRLRTFLLRLVPVAGWIYFLAGLVRPFEDRRLRALWWLVGLLSTAGHGAQLFVVLPRARRLGISRRRAAAATMLLGATWRPGRGERR